MKYSANQLQKFLKQKGNEFEFEGIKFKVVDTKYKQLYDYELGKNIPFIQPKNINKWEFKMLKVKNPYIYAFYDIYNKHYYTSQKTKIEDINNEYISNFSSTINDFYNNVIAMLQYDINHYNKLYKSLVVHKINFLTNEVVEVFDNSRLKSITKIFHNFKFNINNKKIYYIRDHYCRNIDKEFYVIYFPYTNQKNIDELYFDLMDDMITKDKIHKNKTGLYLKIEQYNENTEQELFYIKLKNSNMKDIKIYHCSNLEIKSLNY